MLRIIVQAQNTFWRLRDDESAQGLVEYALIIGVVSLGAVVALGFLSGKINALFSDAGNKLGDLPTTTTTP